MSCSRPRVAGVIVSLSIVSLIAVGMLAITSGRSTDPTVQHAPLYNEIEDTNLDLHFNDFEPDLSKRDEIASHTNAFNSTIKPDEKQIEDTFVSRYRENWNSIRECLLSQHQSLSTSGEPSQDPSYRGKVVDNCSDHISNGVCQYHTLLADVHSFQRRLMHSLPQADLQEAVEDCLTRFSWAHTPQAHSSIRCDTIGFGSYGSDGACACTLTKVSFPTPNTIRVFAANDQDADHIRESLHRCNAVRDGIQLEITKEHNSLEISNQTLYFSTAASNGINRIQQLIMFADLLNDDQGIQWRIPVNIQDPKFGLAIQALDDLFPFRVVSQDQCSSCVFAAVTIGVSGWIYEATGTLRGHPILYSRARNILHLLRGRLSAYIDDIAAHQSMFAYSNLAAYSESNRVGVLGLISFMSYIFVDGSAAVFQGARSLGFETMRFDADRDPWRERVLAHQRTTVLYATRPDYIDEMIALPVGASIFLSDGANSDSIETIASMLGLSVSIKRSEQWSLNAARKALHVARERVATWHDSAASPQFQNIPEVSQLDWFKQDTSNLSGRFRARTRTRSAPHIDIYRRSVYGGQGRVSFDKPIFEDREPTIIPGLTFIVTEPVSHLAHWVEYAVFPAVYAIAARHGQVPKFNQYRVVSMSANIAHPLMSAIESAVASFMQPAQAKFSPFPNGDAHVMYEYAIEVDVRHGITRLYPTALDDIRSRLNEIVSGKPLPPATRHVPPCRIHLVNRKPHEGRSILQIDILREALKNATGLPVVDVEFSPSDGVGDVIDRVFGDGSAVLSIMPEGNGMTNYMFAPRGSGILYITPNQWTGADSTWLPHFPFESGLDSTRLVVSSNSEQNRISSACIEGGLSVRWDHRLDARGLNLDIQFIMPDILLKVDRYMRDNARHCM